MQVTSVCGLFCTFVHTKSTMVSCLQFPQSMKWGKFYACESMDFHGYNSKEFRNLYNHGKEFNFHCIPLK